MSMPPSPQSPQEPEQNFDLQMLTPKPEIESQTSPPSSASTPPPPSSPIHAKPLQSLSPAKKTPPLPWSNQETVNLIRAYQEKWYSLKRGQLKASQWEEVAVTVAARCGYDEPSKTATQCRHKIEKLRKRFRAEKQKPNPRGWEYFDLMDCLERGPLPISARPIGSTRYAKPNPNPGGADGANDSGDSDRDGDDEIYDANYNIYRSSKGISHIARGARSRKESSLDRKLNGFSERFSGFGKNMNPGKRKNRFESGQSDCEEEDADDHDEEEEGSEERGNRKVVFALAAEVRAFAKRFQRMENKKIEMMKETERYRIDMENKQMDMIMESQRTLVDAISRALASHKKLKMTQEI